jgi:hypothetical protein
MGMIATSTFLCTIVVHIYFRGSGPMPTILRRVLFKDLFFLKKNFFVLFLLDFSGMVGEIFSYGTAYEYISTTCC